MRRHTERPSWIKAATSVAQAGRFPDLPAVWVRLGVRPGCVPVLPRARVLPVRGGGVVPAPEVGAPPCAGEPACRTHPGGLASEPSDDLLHPRRDIHPAGTQTGSPGAGAGVRSLPG